MDIGSTRLDAFMGRFVQDIGAVLHAATVVVGDRLGLFRSLAEGGPQTAEELAARTETDSRYLREWLSAQAASGYVDFDPASARFSMNPEQTLALTVEGGPAFIPGAFEIAVAQFKAIPKMASVLRTGLGFGWHEHDASLFRGTERFFRPGYAANLVSSWVPSLHGLHDKLEAGAKWSDDLLLHLQGVVEDVLEHAGLEPGCYAAAGPSAVSQRRADDRCRGDQHNLRASERHRPAAGVSVSPGR